MLTRKEQRPAGVPGNYVVWLHRGILKEFTHLLLSHKTLLYSFNSRRKKGRERTQAEREGVTGVRETEENW